MMKKEHFFSRARLQSQDTITANAQIIAPLGGIGDFEKHGRVTLNVGQKLILEHLLA
jgi:hypothetical protein